MKKYFMLCVLIVVPFFCFSQNIKVKGETVWIDGTLYRIQAGAYTVQQNAARIFTRLQRAGLNPEYEHYRDIKRILLTGIPARDIPAILGKLAAAGTSEVWITGEKTIDGKWEIVTPNSPYASFEFSGGGNYIVVEQKDKADNPVVHFGDYIFRDRNIMELKQFGILKIQEGQSGRTDFTFTKDSGQEVTFTGEKSANVSESPETDLFSKTWRVRRINGRETAGTEDDKRLLFSRAGTYLVISPGRGASMAQWQWKDETGNEFHYSWDNWNGYGTCVIKDLTADSLSFEDSTYGGPAFEPELIELSPDI
ncbi:MAG: hypothetical protein LBD48_15190 [Treponema sp.]|jgi:hypothetical protein|nr:hypothetical protein [Treponema sp.]